MIILLSVFKWIVYSTLLGSVLAGIILLCRQLFREKLGVRWNYCVWLILLARLLIPYAPQSSLSIFNLVNFPQSKVAKTINVPSYTLVNTATYTNENQQSLSEANKGKARVQDSKALENKATISKELCYKIACLIWLIGAMMLGSYILMTIIFFMSKLSTQKACEDEDIIELLERCKNKVGLNIPIAVISTDLVKTPAIFGSIRPKLLLPEDINKRINIAELRYIIFHELAHLKRKDTTIGFVASLLQILHWFNPVIWYSFHRMRQDRELACDALALSFMEPDEYLKYGKTLIKLLESYARPACAYGMTCIISSKSQIWRRVNMISFFKKNSYRWTIVPIIVLIVLSCTLLTDGKSSSKLAANKVSSGNSVAAQSTVDELSKAVLENDTSTVDKILKSNTVNIDKKDSSGKYPLESVLVFGNCEMAETLLKAGADANVITSDGVSIYDTVMKSDNKQMKTIFEKYKNQSKVNESNSVSEYDIQSGNYKGKMLVISNPAKIAVGFSKQLGNSGETTSNIAKDNNAIAAINGGVFKQDDTSGNCKPSGIIIHGGKTVYSDLKSSGEKVNVAAITEKGILLTGSYTTEELNKVGVQEAVTSVRTLIVNGKPQITEGDGGLGVGPRTAIGQKSDGTILLVTIDGRSKESIGATLRELQDILIKNGAYNAANLDGGSSSTMYYNDKVINHPCDAAGERNISSAFVVLK